MNYHLVSLVLSALLGCAIGWIISLRGELRNTIAVNAELLLDRKEWGKESEFYRAALMRWQDWGRDILKSRGLRLPHCLWGDHETWKIIENVANGRDPFDGFEDPKFHDALIGEEPDA